MFDGETDSPSRDREQGKAATDLFTQRKTIYVDRSGSYAPGKWSLI